VTDTTIRVAIADDEPLVRAGVRAIVESESHLRVVGDAGDGLEATELVRTHRIDVLLLDIEMPHADGIAALEEIRRSGQNVRVLILTTFGTENNLRRCLAAGADGFLIKASAPAEIIAAIEAVAAGGTVIAPRVARYLVESFRNQAPSHGVSSIGALSPRETDVLRLLSCGLSNAEIAGRLHLTEGTVKGYVSAILLTLGVDNRVQAALIGYDAGLTRAEV
jgi:DNA-binding NarL/FixJ family response regulator